MPVGFGHAGADVQDRTGDLVLTKDALCQLSYIGLRASTFALSAWADKVALRPTRSAERSSACASECFDSLTRLPRRPAGLPAEAGAASEDWSGRRGSNPRPTAWKAVTLPLSYSRLRVSLLHASARKPALRARSFPYGACNQPSLSQARQSTFALRASVDEPRWPAKP